MYADTHKGQNDVGTPQAQNADNCELPDKGLGTELRFSGRSASALSHRVSSPAST